ncbi:MAG: hypothetical protein INR71_02215 [Terriglobus roseus]|nr:hypothetical protein [Terriglobus roseus]
MDLFHCIGKLWTSVQMHKPRQSSAGTNVSFSPDGESTPVRSIPLFSLRDRWLAVVPPPSSSQFSLYGTVSDQSRVSGVPGLTVSMSPNPPAINCAVDTPDDRFMSRMSRMAAKNLMKGAQWAGDYGKQLWKHYVGQNPTSPPNGPLGAQAQYQQDPQQYFPPTHAANDAPRPTYEPPTVAVYDLNRLLAAAERKSKNALSPIAVFEQALGCSYLSFSPSGLHILTVSKKGDTQILWDLKRMCHGRGANLAARGNSILGPHVREVARVSRVTDANVVDIIWSPPKDDKFAVLTDKGTLHVHQIDAALLQWPPPRRIARQHVQTHSHASSAQPSKQTSPEPPSPSQRSRLNSAYDAVNGATSWLSSIRSRSISGSNGLPSLNSLSLTPAAGAKSAKAVAASAGKAIGQGVRDFRHAADNKIYMHATNAIVPRCAMWMTGGARGLIAVVADGNVKMFKVRSVLERARGKGGKESKRIVVKAINQMLLQSLPKPRVAPAVVGSLKSRVTTDLLIDEVVQDAPGPEEPQGMWQPRSPSTSSRFQGDRRPSERVMWKSYAELETTYDYAKFHTDPRVSLFVYADGGHTAMSTMFGDDGSGSGTEEAAWGAHREADDSAPWVFGGDIAVTKISTGAAAAVSAGVIAGDDDAEGFVWRNARDGDEGDGEGEGFFEDDADVIDFAEDRV